MTQPMLVSSCCCGAAADDCCAFWSSSDKTYTSLVVEVTYRLEADWASGGSLTYYDATVRYEFDIAYVGEPVDCDNSRYVGYTGSVSVAMTCRSFLPDDQGDDDFFSTVDNTSRTCEQTPYLCPLIGCSWPSAGCDYDIEWCVNITDEIAVVGTVTNTLNPLVEIRCDSSSCKCCSGCILPAIYTYQDESRSLTVDSWVRSPGCANLDPVTDLSPANGGSQPMVPRAKTIGACGPLSGASFLAPVVDSAGPLPYSFDQTFYDYIQILFGSPCDGLAYTASTFPQHLCGSFECSPYPVSVSNKGSYTHSWFCYDYDTFGNLISINECTFKNSYRFTCTGNVTVTLS